MLLSAAFESLGSTKSLITRDSIKSSSVISMFLKSMRLKLKLFETGERIPNFANVAH